MSLSHVTIVITPSIWSALGCLWTRSPERTGNAKSAGKLDNSSNIICSLKSEAVKEKKEQMRVQMAERESKI